MTDFDNELRHDGWQYEEPPTPEEQAAIDAEAEAAWQASKEETP